MGISYSEYAQLSAARASSVSTYTATGGSLSVAAGGPDLQNSQLHLSVLIKMLITIALLAL